MDFERLKKRVEKLEKSAAGFAKAGDGAAQAMKNYAETLRDVLMDLLKERKEPVRPGHLFQDAAAKGLVPGDSAQRGDNLLIRWGGRVTPTDPKTVADDAGHFQQLSEKLLPVLKAYKPAEPEGK